MKSLMVAVVVAIDPLNKTGEKSETVTAVMPRDWACADAGIRSIARPHVSRTTDARLMMYPSAPRSC